MTALSSQAPQQCIDLNQAQLGIATIATARPVFCAAGQLKKSEHSTTLVSVWAPTALSLCEAAAMHPLSWTGQSLEPAPAAGQHRS